MVRGGRIHGGFFPLGSPRTPQDIEGDMALGDVTGQTGGKGGEDAIGSALKLLCSTLDSLPLLSTGWTDQWAGLMIRLPMQAMLTAAGLRIPLPGHAESARKAREILWTITRADAPNGYPVWLGGPEEGPRAARARALARVGVQGPFGDSRPADGAKQQDPWKDTEKECPICFGTYGDPLPDILVPSSRTTPFACIEGHRHGACWGCCIRMKDAAEDSRTATRCHMCRAVMDPDDEVAFPDEGE